MVRGAQQHHCPRAGGHHPLCCLDAADVGQADVQEHEPRPQAQHRAHGILTRLGLASEHETLGARHHRRRRGPEGHLVIHYQHTHYVVVRHLPTLPHAGCGRAGATWRVQQGQLTGAGRGRAGRR